MNRMECYVINRKDILGLASLGHIGPVALEGKVVLCPEHGGGGGGGIHYPASQVPRPTYGLGGLMYWIATRPSMEPRAKPVGWFCLSLKILMHLCWYFNGLSILYKEGQVTPTYPGHAPPPPPPHHAYLELGRSVLQLVDHQTSGGCAHKSHGVHLFEGALAQNTRQV